MLWISLLTAYAVFWHGLASIAATGVTAGMSVEPLPDKSPVTFRLIFDYGLAMVCAAWFVGLVAQRRLPSIPRFVVFVTLALLLHGWVSVWNAQYDHSFFDHTHERGFRSPDRFSFEIPWLPQSFNQAQSLVEMVHMSVVMLGGWMIIDVCRRRGHRKLLLINLAILGLVFSLIGLFQKAGGDSLFFPKPDGPVWNAEKSFASYVYHGNAATFLNFCWPIGMVLLLAAWVKNRGGAMRVVYACAAFFTLASLFVNTSKLGHVSAPFLLVLFVFFYRKTIRRLTRGLPWRRTIGVVFVALVLVGFGLMASLTLNVSAERWSDVAQSKEARFKAYGICFDMIAEPESCLFGMGPGAFSTVFPTFAAKAGKSFGVFYHRAHQDYLQCLIEWGVVGFAMWMALLAYVFVAGVKKIKQESFYAAAILIAILSAVLQGFVDFPAQIASLQWVGIMLCGVIISPSPKV